MLQPAFTKALNVVLLQGHQNVGELRRDFMVVTVAYYHCRVTRMLVSYDTMVLVVAITLVLQGHQNVGELRLKTRKELERWINCRVTRMLVSYDLKDLEIRSCNEIAGSPECW